MSIIWLSERRRRRTTFRRNLNRNMMVAGGLSKKYGPYGLINIRKKSTSFKASTGARGNEIEIRRRIGRGRNVGIGYSDTRGVYPFVKKNRRYNMKGCF